jgi:transposase
MDNASQHKINESIELCLKNKIKVITCTPYYSKLNMIEYVFGYKNYIKKKYQTLNELVLVVKKILK